LGVSDYEESLVLSASSSAVPAPYFADGGPGGAGSAGTGKGAFVFFAKGDHGPGDALQVRSAQKANRAVSGRAQAGHQNTCQEYYNHNHYH
jgi:hypothetical protein